MCQLEDMMPRLGARARRLVPAAEAEDLVQEAALRIWTRLQRGAPVEDLDRYAMTTLRHLAIDRHRGHTATEELEENSLSCESEAPARLACTRLAQAIARLPRDQSSLMGRVSMGETSPARLAAELGLPTGTVMSRLARARATLRRELQVENVGDLLG